MNVSKKLIYTIFSLLTAFWGTDLCARDIINIWIHGTRLTPSSFSKKYLFRLHGMHNIADYPASSNHRTIIELLNKADPEAYNLQYYYIFGWSGKLCFKERKAAAKELYAELEKLYLSHIEDSGQPPMLRIITHSHGGNVLLNLAKIIPEDSPIVIDEVIILACPVQDKTKKLVQASCFKKIYAFYSANDMFQVLDPQGWYKKGKTKKIFSGRAFDHCDKLRQARIKLNGHHPMHIDFFMPKFIMHLPQICKTLDSCYHSMPELSTGKSIQLDIRYKDNPFVIYKTVF